MKKLYPPLFVIIFLLAAALIARHIFWYPGAVKTQYSARLLPPSEWQFDSFFGSVEGYDGSPDQETMPVFSRSVNLGFVSIRAIYYVPSPLYVVTHPRERG